MRSPCPLPLFPSHRRFPVSAPSITKADDVIEYLVAQHETIKKLFVETLDAAG